MLSLRKFSKVALFAAVASAAATAAYADSSCDALFARVHGEASRVMSGKQQYAYVLWTTNYSIPNSDARFSGVARAYLRGNGQGGVYGNAFRTETYYDFQLRARPAKKRLPLYLSTTNDGKIFISAEGSTFGPFDPTCSDDKFAVVRSGDSVEVFSFVGTSSSIPYAEWEDGN